MDSRLLETSTRDKVRDFRDRYRSPIIATVLLNFEVWYGIAIRVCASWNDFNLAIVAKPQVNMQC